ncbi:MAG: CHAD domain-containing protein, partial [Chloroflexota bacterium]|nr:CHAD domain-containing protein [Chloroflexota bacterium]
WRTVEIEDRYVDTAERSLEAAGYGVRLRRIDGHRLVTVKSMAQDAQRDGEPQALHRRLELEAPASARLDPATWPEGPARERIESLIGGERLRTRFTLVQRRLERDLVSDGLQATLSLDTAEVRRRGESLGTFATLEVEAADGADRLLSQLAGPLESTGLISAETRSKERIAHEMVADALAAAAEAARPTRTRPAVPKHAGVRIDDPLAEAGRKVLGLHLARMLSVEDGARSGEDPEHVHKMRVATRRMRAAWRVFDGAYRTKPQKRYVRELREVATTLGWVRDMDVQLEDLARYAKSLEPEAAADLAPLADAWRTRRDSARDDLLTLLDSKAYRRFVDEYLAFVSTPGGDAVEDDATRPMRVRDTAAGRIWQAYEQVRAHEAGLPWADVPALHALRIDGKRLRYTLESFREVLPARQTEELLAVVTRMQDHLGLLNDADVAATATREWLMSAASGLAPAAREAAGAYLVAREAEMPRLRRSFPVVWRRVAGPTFRRRLALAISAL